VADQSEARRLTEELQKRLEGIRFQINHGPEPDKPAGSPNGGAPPASVPSSGAAATQPSQPSQPQPGTPLQSASPPVAQPRPADTHTPP
jgi:hypothetical protein